MKKIAYAVILVFSFSFLSACNTEPSSEEYIEKGLSYMEKMEWKSAIIEFKNAVKQSPDNARARALLGQTYIETRSANAAIKELTRAIELGYDKNPLTVPLALAYRQAGENQKIIDEIEPNDSLSVADNAIINALRGTAFLFVDDKVAARAALDQAKSQDGEATEVRLAWAMFENLNGDFEAQERWLQPLLERDGGVADAWSQMGMIEERRRDGIAAEKAYSRAIEIRDTPHFDYVRRAMVRVEIDDIEGARADVAFVKEAGANWPMLAYAEGMIAFKSQDYAAAQAHFLETQVQLPGFPPAKLMAGLSFFYQQKYTDTVLHLRKYLKTTPGNERVSVIYATSLLATQKSAEAVKVLEELDAREPNNYRVLAMLSSAYQREGKAEESLEVLQRAVRIAPEVAETRLRLGASLMQSPSTAAAGREELKKALELDPSFRKAKLVLYMSHLRQKEFTQALQIAQDIEQSGKSSSIGANLIGLTYLAKGEIDKAKQQFRDTLTRFPADFITSHNLGRIYISEKAFAEARALYIKVIDKTPNQITSLEQLALISAREGNQGDMMQWLQKAVDRNPEQSRPRLVLALQYLQQNKAAEAVKILNDVDVEDKEGTGFVILMSRAKIGLREYNHAQRMLDGLTQRQPDLAEAHFLLAQIYAAQSDREKMRESLQQTVEIVPNHLMAQIILARLDLVEGDEASFNTRLAMLEENYPGNAKVRLLKAQSASVDKDYESAIKQLSNLLADTPQSDVVMELARNQWQAGDRQGAISSLELWSESNVDNQVLLRLAEYYLFENRNEEATATYKTLQQLLPGNATILNNLAWSLKDSNPKKGLEYARKASDLVPENPLIMDTLAMLLLKNGEKRLALETVQRAAQKAPGVADIQLNLAEILNANGKKEQAREVLEKLLIGVEGEEQKQMVRDRINKL